MDAPALLRAAAGWVSRALLRPTIRGQENVPRTGGVLLAMNHLGGADPVLLVAFAPRPVGAMGKAEALRWPLIGAILRAYGMVPVRRGMPDRAALGGTLKALRDGKAFLIAPEGIESRTGALEPAKEGAAFLAKKARVPIVPVAITGTAWKHILRAWKRLRRPAVTVTFGAPFCVPAEMTRPEATEMIMRRIAAMLPEEYRGVYG